MGPAMYYNAIDESANVPANDDGAGLTRQINLRDLWAPIYRSRYAVMAIMVAALSLAVIATLMIKPIYQAEATVEIRQETQKVLGTEDEADQALASFDVDRFLQTQLDIIRSRSTTTAVAQALGLYRGTAFLETMNVDPESAKTGILSPEEAHRDLVNNTLRDNLSVSFSDETRIANIEFESPDPRLSAAVANSYAENYNRMNLARRFDASRYSLEFLRGQIREAQMRLADSERSAIAYAKRTGIVDASNAALASGASSPRSITTASLVQANEELSKATAQRIAAEERWKQTQSASPLSVPKVLESPAVQHLISQRAELRGQYEEQLERRRSDYPEVRQAAARLSELDRQIAALAGHIRSSVREEYEDARAQEQALQQRLSPLK